MPTSLFGGRERERLKDIYVRHDVYDEGGEFEGKKCGSWRSVSSFEYIRLRSWACTCDVYRVLRGCLWIPAATRIPCNLYGNSMRTVITAIFLYASD